MDNQASHVSKSPLILLLHTVFATIAEKENFKNLLRTARVVIDDITCRELEGNNNRPALVQTWLRKELRDWHGPIALFVWANDDDVVQAASKIGTLDQFIPAVREARKVLMLRKGQLDPPYMIHEYISFDGDGRPSRKALLLLREDPPYHLETVRALGNFLGTRDRPRAPTETLLAARSSEEPREPGSSPGTPIGTLGVPSKPERGDQTLQAFALEDPRTGKMRAVPARRDSAAIEAVRLGSGRPDPRAEDEDRIETIPPGPGEGPPEPLPPLRERGDATRPK